MTYVFVIVHIENCGISHMKELAKKVEFRDQDLLNIFHIHGCQLYNMQVLNCIDYFFNS
jgi:hypothetical protein